ncbi:MAG TPA: hypothetical protein VJY31_18000 [Buttiauxella sp.]|nr:hypothetical protein [Buttiauxella sp.]
MTNNNVGLNVKIDAELKERVRQHAELNGITINLASAQLLQAALDSLGKHAEVSDQEIDNQHTEEDDALPLTSREIKSLRKLLKKKK